VSKHSLLPLLFFCAASAWAQPFSAGVKVGLPLTDFIHTVSGESSTVTNRYLVGPTAELHLPFGLGIEVDALYRHFNYQNIFGSGVNAVTSLNTTGAWEFPVLLKYRFPGKLARPYLDAGVAWDKLAGLSNTITHSVSSGTIVNPSGEANSSTTGFVIGGGLDLHFVVHILPELRYTRWTSQHFNLASILNSSQNQAEFMVGITF
jgi:Outer membrane protein beta-barrel domain